MWKQISLTEALQGYMAGQNVKLVDLVEETVVGLQDVFKSMQKSAVFFVEEADKAPGTIPPDKLVEWVVDGSPDPATELEPPNATDAGLPVQNVKQTISDAVKQVAEDLVPTAAAPEPPRVAGRKTTERKISDLGKLRSLRAAGWDVEKIATEFGCSGQTVRNTMKREGIE